MRCDRCKEPGKVFRMTGSPPHIKNVCKKCFWVQTYEDARRDKAVPCSDYLVSTDEGEE